MTDLPSRERMIYDFFLAATNTRSWTITMPDGNVLALARVDVAVEQVGKLVDDLRARLVPQNAPTVHLDEKLKAERCKVCKGDHAGLGQHFQFARASYHKYEPEEIDIVVGKPDSGGPGFKTLTILEPKTTVERCDVCGGLRSDPGHQPTRAGGALDWHPFKLEIEMTIGSPIPTEPKTTDYCLRCGESPESGDHVLGQCEYLDPREVPEPAREFIRQLRRRISKAIR